ncbi:alpha/beta hydrolase [Azohydromonas lata]|uniref:Alpha/beta hydrolase n=1 Tax=Azohydromonas lata TaxID=45677 RepID=A0ABU5IQ89_9BURK|nr:alpha/beta hydrolase [Azohydromonas lata]MDZ5461060.1 alpha/beta hydrolase [Azohydromonas lata]
MLRVHPYTPRSGLPRPWALAAALGLGAALSWQGAMAADKLDARTGTRYKADKDMAAVLDTLAAMSPKPIETLTVEEARKQPTPADAVKALLKSQDKESDPARITPDVTATDRTIPGAAGPLPARVYTPKEGGSWPVIVYFHGGGWVLGSKESYDAAPRALSGLVKAVVVSVDYRLAPEHKFPAQHDDALAVYHWVAERAADLQGDPKRLALAGESAGANLALSTAISARQAGMTPPQHVLAVYPMVQLTDLDTPSYRDSAQAKPLNKAMMGWFADKVFSSPGQKQDPRVDLLRADLSLLPTVTLIRAQIDPLRSDGELLERALKKAHVSFKSQTFAGVTHEFFGMAPAVGNAKSAQHLAAKELRQGFERSLRVSDKRPTEAKVEDNKAAEAAAGKGK